MVRTSEFTILWQETSLERKRPPGPMFRGSMKGATLS